MDCLASSRIKLVNALRSYASNAATYRSSIARSAALLALEHVQADVGRDPVQPGPHRRASLELVPAAPRADKGILHRVFGVEGRPEHPVAVRRELAAVLFHVAKRMGSRERRGLHPADFKS